MFNINDTVMYGSSGVCEIIDIQPKHFNGEEILYYVIKPVDQENSTIYCPVNGKARIRKLLTAEEVHELIGTISETEAQWIDNDRQRREVFSDIIKRGDQRELIMLIKSIRLNREKKVQSGKKLHADDERFLKDAENIVYGEFTTALKMKRDEVIPYIESKLCHG